MVNLKRQLAYNSFFISVSTNIQKLISIFLFLILVANLGVHEYGVLALLFTIPSPTLSIMGIGLDRFIISEIARARGQNRFDLVKSIIFQYFKIGLIIFAVLLVISFFAKNILSNYYNIYLLKYYGIIMIYIIGNYLATSLRKVLSGYEEFFKNSVLGISESLFRLLAILYLLFFSNLNTGSAFLVYGLAKVFYFCLGIILLRKIFSILINEKQEERVLTGLVKKTGKWLILKNIVSSFTNNIVPWLIKIFLSTEAIAYHRVASKIYSTVVNVLPFDSLMTPLISKNVKNRNLITIVVQKARKYYYIYSLFVILLIWLFIDLVVLTFIPEYLPSIILIKLMSFRLIFNGMSLGQQGILYANNRQKFMFFFFFYTTFQSILFYFVGLKYFGLIGMVIFYTIHVLIVTIVKNIYIKRSIGLLRYKIKDYFQYDKYDRMIINSIKKKISLLRVSKT